MADQEDFEDRLHLYRRYLKAATADGVQPTAYDRHYRIPIYSDPRTSALLKNRQVRGAYVDGPTKYGQANKVGPAIVTQSPIDPGTISHELVHHIDTTDDPKWAGRVGEALFQSPTLQSLYTAAAMRMYGNREAETRAFVTSDTLTPDSFEGAPPKVNLIPIPAQNVRDWWNDLHKIAPNRSEHVITDPGLLRKLRELMYNQLNEKGKAALKSRQH